MRLQAMVTSWGGSLFLRVRQHRALPQGWQTGRRSLRLPLATASAGGSHEQPAAPQTASDAQQSPIPQPPPDAWEQACPQVAAFQRQHGRLPRATADAQGQPLLPGERPLGLWCTEQQRRKAGSKGPSLTVQEQAALLAISGWSWWVTKPVTKPWEQWRQEVEAFYQQHGRLPRMTTGKLNPFLPGEKQLGGWVFRQRRRYKGSIQPPLSAGRIAALEAIPGWEWMDSPPWEQRRQEVEAFNQQHGRLPRTKTGKARPFTPGEEELGEWVRRQRQRYKGNKQPPLSAEHIAALEATPGWIWEEHMAWEARCEQVQDFIDRHGRLPKKTGGERSPLLPGERVLGKWCATQRLRQKGKSHQQPLTVQQQAALAALPGWYWVHGG